MHHFPRYEHYKDSGVAWLGEIPAHWEVSRSKRLFQHRNERARKDDEQLTSSQKFGVISQKEFMELEGRRVTQVEFNHEILKHIEPNDFLISMRSFQGGIEFSRYKGCVSSAYVVLTPTRTIIPEFYQYLFKCHGYIQALSSTSNLVRDGQALRFENFTLVDLVVLPQEEQTAIAEFLDQKTAQIDRAIAQKEKLIALLQERRQILIHQAVTRGLNSKAPMKDSGVAWLGQVPAHWEVKRAKYLFDEIDARSETGDEELLSVSHMTGVTPRSEKNVSMFQAEDYTGSKLCQRDDLIFNIMWAWMGALGVSDRTGIVSPSYAVYRPKQPGAFNAWYLENLLRDGNYVAEYNRVSTGLHSSRLRLYSHMFFRMEIGFPAREEQDEIERATKKKTTLIDDEIARTQGVIEKLKEYKATLINSAVTGKIKIPALRNPEGM